MCIAVLSPWVHPRFTVLPSLLAVAFPILLIINLLLGIVLAAIKLRWAFLPVVAIIGFWSPIQRHWNLSSTSDAVTEVKNEFRVATFNLFGLKSIKKSDDDALFDELDEILVDSPLDAICFQESNGFSNRLLDERTKDRFKYENKAGGVKLISRHELVTQGAFEFNSNVNACVWADIKKGDEVVRVYCAHLQSNSVGDNTSQLIEKGNLTEKNTWLGIGNIVDKYKRASKLRESQGMSIKTHAVSSQNPVLLCGDLNDHPLSYSTSELRKGWQDTFEEGGSGWGTTYGGPLPLLRIDYVMADSNFQITHHEVLKTNLSDHYFVEARVKLKE